jgi:hypothetical protein
MAPVRAFFSATVPAAPAPMLGAPWRRRAAAAHRTMPASGAAAERPGRARRRAWSPGRQRRRPRPGRQPGRVLVRRGRPARASSRWSRTAWAATRRARSPASRRSTPSGVARVAAGPPAGRARARRAGGQPRGPRVWRRSGPSTRAWAPRSRAADRRSGRPGRPRGRLARLPPARRRPGAADPRPLVGGRPRAPGAAVEDEARRHRWRNVITNALGAGPDFRLDLGTFDVRAGDRFLLCSDGVSMMVSDGLMTQILGDHAAAGGGRGADRRGERPRQPRQRHRRGRRGRRARERPSATTLPPAERRAHLGPGRRHDVGHPRRSRTPSRSARRCGAAASALVPVPRLDRRLALPGAAVPGLLHLAQRS